jgi:hypothetical protein
MVLKNSLIRQCRIKALFNLIVGIKANFKCVIYNKPDKKPHHAALTNANPLEWRI